MNFALTPEQAMVVETVRGFATQEREVLTQVTQARASATQVQVTPEQLSDPQAVQQFQAAQNNLSGALGRLLVTVEKYPELRSQENFLTLQSQLEGTENRIGLTINTTGITSSFFFRLQKRKLISKKTNADEN